MREAALIFQFSRMGVVDEIKSRMKMSTLCFVDFLEGMLRVACRKRMPTQEMLDVAGKRRASLFFAAFKEKPGGYDRFLENHREHCILKSDPIGQPPVKALHMFLDVLSESVLDRRTTISRTSSTISMEDIAAIAAMATSNSK